VFMKNETPEKRKSVCGRFGAHFGGRCSFLWLESSKPEGAP
jgi:hypothetical protein